MKIRKEDYKKGYLILVNYNHFYTQIPENISMFSPNFPNIKLENETLINLKKALQEISAKDCIIPISGYRTEKEQRKLYHTSLKENGKDYTKKFVAKPSTSEHQTGLAIDLGKNIENFDFICPSFPNYGIFKKFREIAQEYGFIERYTEEKKNITKIAKEEWHFRYVSYPHSKIMTELHFCLEEYIEYLHEFSYPTNPLKKYGYKIFFLPLQEEIELDLKQNDCISGNNKDGFILTIKEEENAT